MGTEDVKVTAMNMYKYNVCINVTFPWLRKRRIYRRKYSYNRQCHGRTFNANGGTLDSTTQHCRWQEIYLGPQIPFLLEMVVLGTDTFTLQSSGTTGKFKGDEAVGTSLSAEDYQTIFSEHLPVEWLGY